MARIYAAGSSIPVDVDPIDVDGVVMVAFDWSSWLQEKELSSVAESSWHVGDGLLAGDGVTSITRKAKVVTPPAPNIVPGEEVPTIALGLTTVYLYVDTASVGDVVEVSNHIRAGSVTEERTLRIQVKER